MKKNIIRKHTGIYIYLYVLVMAEITSGVSVFIINIAYILITMRLDFNYPCTTNEIHFKIQSLEVLLSLVDFIIEK